MLLNNMKQSQKSPISIDSLFREMTTNLKEQKDSLDAWKPYIDQLKQVVAD